MSRLVSLFLLFFVCSLQAQEIIIEPAHPQVGDNVRVGVLINTPGYCVSLPAVNTSQGVTHWLSQPNGDSSLLYVVANITPGVNCPIYQRYFYDLGQLNEGQHGLIFNYFSPSVTFQAVDFDPPPPYISMSFEVFGAPRVVASTSTFALLLLFVLLFVIATIRLKSL